MVWFLIAATVIGGISAIFLSNPKGGNDSGAKDAKPVAKIKPVTSQVRGIPKEAKTDQADAAPENEYQKRFPGQKILSVVTNQSGYIVVETMAQNGDRTTRFLTPPPIFKHSTDDLIMMALSTPEGQELPPLPDLGGRRADVEFRKSLKTEIVDSPDDSEKVKARKAIVRAAREEIAARMDNGEHFADILYEHAKLLNENGAIRRNAEIELRRLVKEGKVDDADVYAQAINDSFQKLGITPITDYKTPKKLRP